MIFSIITFIEFFFLGYKPIKIEDYRLLKLKSYKIYAIYII